MVDDQNDPDYSRYMVPGLERGLRLLCEFSRDEPTLTGAELARRLGAPRSTVFRLLMTLEAMGFVERTDDARTYRLGLAVLRLGFEYLASQGITDLAQPVIERIRDVSSRSTNLVVRDGRDIVYLLRAAATSPFASSISVGTRLPAHATVLGQMLLGDLSLSELRRLYPEPRLEAHGVGTPTTAEALFDHVQALRQAGVGISEGGFEPNISSVASPVFDAQGHVVAVIGVVVPNGSIATDERERLVELVRDGAGTLSKLLDYPGDAKAHSSTSPTTPTLRAVPSRGRGQG